MKEYKMDKKKVSLVLGSGGARGYGVQIKICTKADTDPLVWLNSSFPAPSGVLSA